MTDLIVVEMIERASLDLWTWDAMPKDRMLMHADLTEQQTRRIEWFLTGHKNQQLQELGRDTMAAMSFEEFCRTMDAHNDVKAKARADFRRKYGKSKHEIMEAQLDDYCRVAYQTLKAMVLAEKDFTSNRQTFVKLNAMDKGTRGAFSSPSSDVLRTSSTPDPVARKIGEKLNERGGFAAMQQVGETLAEFCREYADENPDKWIVQTDGRDIEMCWDGIGQWRM